jgi:DNA-binding response OmpR family regulator
LVLKKARILVVDDDRTIAESLSIMLQYEGYETDVAYTGTEAIEKSRKNVYNLAILDIRLPDIEGTDLLVLLRETSPKMVKIMLTGNPMFENAVKSLNNGADAYLVKPVDIPELLETIKNKIEEQKTTETATEDSITAFLQTRKEKLLESARFNGAST